MKLKNSKNSLLTFQKFFFSKIKQSTLDVSLKFSIMDHNQPKTLVLLHGLFGSQNNWRPIAYNELIKNRRNCALIDLRNHGLSDHHNSMTYKEMAEDVYRVVTKELDLKHITLLGHSMGAKTAMALSTLYPELVESLIIVDSAPKDTASMQQLFNSTKQIIDKASEYSLAGKTRRQVLNDFKEMFGGVVANLMNTNLEYVNVRESEQVQWKCNLTAIKDNYRNISGFEKFGEYSGDVRVIKGEKSIELDVNDFIEVFPKIKKSDIVEIEGAGHWVQADKPQETAEAIADFLDKVDNKNKI